jgi:hypothetical protein
MKMAISLLMFTLSLTTYAYNDVEKITIDTQPSVSCKHAKSTQNIDEHLKGYIFRGETQNIEVSKCKMKMVYARGGLLESAYYVTLTIDEQ